jgi:hypothetical protein
MAASGRPNGQNGLVEDPFGGMKRVSSAKRSPREHPLGGDESTTSSSELEGEHHLEQGVPVEL